MLMATSSKWLDDLAQDIGLGFISNQMWIFLALVVIDGVGLEEVAVGARGDNLRNNFLGKVDEVAVHSRILSGQEIEELVALGNAGERILASRNTAHSGQP